MEINTHAGLEHHQVTPSATNYTAMKMNFLTPKSQGLLIAASALPFLPTSTTMPEA